jgi:hypothetical protein
MTRFFFYTTIILLFVLGRPLWREDGSAICSAVCQWSESRRTRNHTLLSRLRLLGSLSVASYDSQGLRWRYSYPPPHGANNMRQYNNWTRRSLCGPSHFKESWRLVLPWILQYNVEFWVPTHHLLKDQGKPRKTLIKLAGRRTFRMQTVF